MAKHRISRRLITLTAAAAAALSFSVAVPAAHAEESKPILIHAPSMKDQHCNGSNGTALINNGIPGYDTIYICSTGTYVIN
jgi:hypothetical protein